MLINYEINTSVIINKLEDLKIYKDFNSKTQKINVSDIARKLGVDRRTAAKYIKGFEKKKTRDKPSQFDMYFDIIKDLLDSESQLFPYKRVLWQYMKDNYNMPGAQSSFRRWISSVTEFNDYFKKNRKSSIKAPSPIRFENSAGEQAQIDWKENMTFVLKNGEVVVINIFCFILSYSRFRIYRLSLYKTQDILLHFLDEAFGIIGGVPSCIVTDNMRTVMDEPRTEYCRGKINNKFSQFANDYGFAVHPCIAGRPNTKAKVEAPMKILDELLAYNGTLSYDELASKLKEINERENSVFHHEYQGIPILLFEKEKAFLGELPRKSIRKHYAIETTNVKVNKSSMISYKSKMYSVPPQYIHKQLQMQVYDHQIHLYYNTELVAVHLISEKRMNYNDDHYKRIIAMTLPFDERKIEEIAKENLRKIGERYRNDGT